MLYVYLGSGVSHDTMFMFTTHAPYGRMWAPALFIAFRYFRHTH